MKKVLYFAVIMMGIVVVTSCGKDEECVCDNGITFSEQDAQDQGVSLSSYCDLAKVGDSSCEIK